MKKIIVSFGIIFFALLAGCATTQENIAEQPNQNESEKQEIAKSSFIPEELLPYAKGENADFIAVIQPNQALSDLIADYEVMAVYQNFKGGFLVANTENEEAISGALLFSDNESADTVKSYLQLLVTGAPAEIIVQTKDNIVTLESESSSSILSGSFQDHPSFTTLEEKGKDSFIIAYNTSLEMATLPAMVVQALEGALQLSPPTYLQSSLIQSAHAQGTGFISASDTPTRIAGQTIGPQFGEKLLMLIGFYAETITTVDYADHTVNLSIQAEGRRQELFAGTSISEDEIEATYKTMSEAIEDSIKDLNEEYAAILQIEANINSDGSMNLTYQQDITPLESIVLAQIEQMEAQFQTGLGDAYDVYEAPAAARDAAAKVAATDFVIALEQYQASNGTYPDGEKCSEDFAELEPYLFPTDYDIKAQIFGSETCSSGIFIQSNPENGYRIWTKMEVPRDEYIEFVSLSEPTEQAGSGQYYVVDKYTLEKSATKPKPKVKR